MALKLARLLDRTPIKVTMLIDQELHARLLNYARLYEEAYGAEAKIEELAPAMIEGFIDSDRYFRGASKRKKSAKGA